SVARLSGVWQEVTSISLGSWPVLTLRGVSRVWVAMYGEGERSVAPRVCGAGDGHMRVMAQEVWRSEQNVAGDGVWRGKSNYTSVRDVASLEKTSALWAEPLQGGLESCAQESCVDGTEGEGNRCDVPDHMVLLNAAEVSTRVCEIIQELLVDLNGA
ncbi:hypothetical protein CYMTET_31076, partial [Cymbomonas tetramitiformis]